MVIPVSFSILFKIIGQYINIYSRKKIVPCNFIECLLHWNSRRPLMLCINTYLVFLELIEGCFPLKSDLVRYQYLMEFLFIYIYMSWYANTWFVSFCPEIILSIQWLTVNPHSQIWLLHADKLSTAKLNLFHGKVESLSNILSMR